MIGENGVIQLVITSTTIIGVVGYLLHSLWTGYSKFREDIYNKISKKLDVEQCKEYRDLEGKVVERIDKDLQRHKEEKQ